MIKDMKIKDKKIKKDKKTKDVLLFYLCFDYFQHRILSRLILEENEASPD